jgi:ABC-type multidrug transport system fused ATPase/permease subunit
VSERRESERLLELAETQYERVRRAEADEKNALRPVRFLQAVVVLVVLAVVGGVFLLTWSPSAISYPVVGLGLVGLLLNARHLSKEMKNLSSQREQLSVERHVLNEVLQLLRESEMTFRTKEGWSVIDQAEFRIRLSRLPVGVDAKTLDFEFVSIRFPLLGSFELSKRAPRRGQDPSEPPILPPQTGANPSR